MNLVFSSNVKRLFFFLLILTNATQAEDCGEVRFSQELNNNLLLRLLAVDNQPVKNKISYQNSFSNHKVLAGERVLHLVQEPIELYQNKELAKLHQSKPSTFKYKQLKRVQKLQPYYDKQLHHYLTVNVDKDETYSFSINDNKVVLISSKKAHCDDSGEIYGKKYSLANLPITDLPKDLSDSLREFAAIKLPRTTNIDNLNNGHFNQVSIYNHFGLVIDTNYGKHGGLRVISSLPNSLAFKIGLRTNDEILVVEGNEIESSDIKPLEQFTKLIKDINYYSTLDLEIIRDDIPKQLSYKIKPVVIPTNWLNSEKSIVASSGRKVSDSSLDEELYYSTVILSLSEYLDKQYENKDRIKVIAKSIPITSIGISGKALVNEGLKITNISEQSVLKDSDLKVGDIIEYIGASREYIANKENLLKYFSSMKNGDSFQLQVKRNDNPLVVTGQYQQRYSPAFSLSVDLKSAAIVNKRLKANRKLWGGEVIFPKTEKFFTQSHAAQSRAYRYSKFYSRTNGGG